LYYTLQLTHCKIYKDLRDSYSSKRDLYSGRKNLHTDKRDLFVEMYTKTRETCTMGWLRLVGSIQLQVSFAEYGLFNRDFLLKRRIILATLLTEATPYCKRALLEDKRDQKIERYTKTSETRTTAKETYIRAERTYIYTKESY